MQAETTRPQRIRSLYIRNVACLAQVEFQPPAEGLILVGGKNAAGKTTLMRAVFAGMGGKVPALRDGQATGQVVLELDDFRVTLGITEHGDRILLEARDRLGQAIRSPKTMLKGIFGKRVFDVPEFLFATAKAQVEALLRIVEIPGSREAIEAVTDGRVDLASVTPGVVEWINAAYVAVSAERQVLNRKIKAVSHRVGEHRSDEEVSPVDLEGLYNKKAQAQQRALKEQELSLAGQRLEETLAQEQALRAQIVKLTAELAELEGNLPEIEAAIEQAKEQNARAAQQADIRQQREELSGLNRESAELSRVLIGIADYKQEAMNKTVFPIPGLDISAGKVLYGGHDLKQASGAEQMLVATAIAAAEVPEDGLQALFILDPPQLDEAAWATLEKFATDRKLQIWIAKVTEKQEASHIYLTEGRNAGMEGRYVDDFLSKM